MYHILPLFFKCIISVTAGFIFIGEVPIRVSTGAAAVLMFSFLSLHLLHTYYTPTFTQASAFSPPFVNILLHIFAER
jgi:hypothetical protein